MKKLSLLAVTGIMALLLAACGENAPKQPDVKSETTVTTEQPSTSAEPAAATTTTTTNTDGATSQE